jgi:hypothetical protein
LLIRAVAFVGRQAEKLVNEPFEDDGASISTVGVLGPTARERRG